LKSESFYEQTDDSAIEHSNSSAGCCTNQLASQHCMCKLVDANDPLTSGGAKSAYRHPNLGILSGGKWWLQRDHSQTSADLILTFASTIALTRASHLSFPPTTATTSTSITHPSERLSFISHSDLLASIPASFHLFSLLTTAVSTSEPPPHIPMVSGLVT